MIQFPSSIHWIHFHYRLHSSDKFDFLAYLVSRLSSGFSNETFILHKFEWWNVNYQTKIHIRLYQKKYTIFHDECNADRAKMQHIRYRNASGCINATFFISFFVCHCHCVKLVDVKLFFHKYKHNLQDNRDSSKRFFHPILTSYVANKPLTMRAGCLLPTLVVTGLYLCLQNIVMYQSMFHFVQMQRATYMG